MTTLITLNNLNEYVTTMQAAVLLGVSRSRVLALIADERLPTVKLAGQHLIRTDDLDLVKKRKAGYPKGRPRK